MSKFLKPGFVSFILFLSLCMAVLVLAFVSQFYHRFFYQRFYENEQQADAARNQAIEKYQVMFNGLKATISFSLLLILFIIFALLGLVLRSKRLTRVLSIFIVLFSVALLISVGIWVGADKPDGGEQRFHADMKNIDKFLKDNDRDIPNYVHTWRNAYYGSIVCMVFSVFFGLVGSSFLFRLIE